jgi:hypothetical protein
MRNPTCQHLGFHPRLSDQLHILTLHFIYTRRCSQLLKQPIAVSHAQRSCKMAIMKGDIAHNGPAARRRSASPTHAQNETSREAISSRNTRVTLCAADHYVGPLCLQCSEGTPPSPQAARRALVVRCMCSGPPARRASLPPLAHRRHGISQCWPSRSRQL